MVYDVLLRAHLYTTIFTGLSQLPMRVIISKLLGMDAQPLELPASKIKKRGHQAPIQVFIGFGR